MLDSSKLQIKAQALQLYKMLSKPFCQRMPFQGVEIAKTLQKILLLNKLFDMKSQAFINLCINADIIQYEPNTQIYSKENKQNRFLYIILEGTAQVKINKKQHKSMKKIQKFFIDKHNNNNKEQEQCHILRQFCLFGYNQIFFHLPERKQTIISGKSSLVCIVFPEDKILQIICQDMKNFMSKAYHYLKVNEYFYDIQQFQKQQLVFYMSLENFKKGDVIVEKESILRKVIFIINGNISVVQQIRNTPYKIDSLEEMNSYGEYECVNKSVCDFELIANSTGSYYTIDYQNLQLNSNHNILKTMYDKAIPYPDIEEISFLYDVKNTLQATCDKVAKRNKLFEKSKGQTIRAANLQKIKK